MNNVTDSGFILVLVLSILPAVAVFLSILAAALSFAFGERKFSLSLAMVCFGIYIAEFAQMILTHTAYHDFSMILNSLPAGGIFLSFIPVVGAIIVIFYDLCVLRKTRNTP